MFTHMGLLDLESEVIALPLSVVARLCLLHNITLCKSLCNISVSPPNTIVRCLKSYGGRLIFKLNSQHLTIIL